MSSHYSYTAIIIAAGLSSRMGGFKPLLDIGGTPALLRLLNTIQNTEIKRVSVVTGHNHEAIEAALVSHTSAAQPQNGSTTRYINPTIVYNPLYESGMFSSIKAGLDCAAKTDDCAAALLFPVDVPLVAAETVGGLIRAWEEGGALHFAAPAYEGKNGHPLLIPRGAFDEILRFAGDGGLKMIRNKYLADMIIYATEDQGCILDMDTAEDYERILEFYKRQER